MRIESGNSQELEASTANNQQQLAHSHQAQVCQSSTMTTSRHHHQNIKPTSEINGCQRANHKSSSSQSKRTAKLRTTTSSMTTTTSTFLTSCQNKRPTRMAPKRSWLSSYNANYLFLLLSLLSLKILKSTSSTISGYNQAASGEVQLAGGSQLFTCGKLYYRTFHMDQQRNVLYIGAMDNLFKVNLANINKTSCLHDAVRLEPADPQKCITKGKSEHFECHNHIKVIQPVSKTGDHIYLCGTNAYNPRDYLLNAANLSVSTEPALGINGPAQAECPFDPEDNSTAIWVESGNPSNLSALYTASKTDFNGADSLIFRPELHDPQTGRKIHEAKRTTKYDSKWLDKPNFVGSFEVGDYVYFFFRESAVEYINCGKSIYSRVARVCKRDNGFKPAMYEKVWTTFLKARLNCSIPGEFPFYFDEIQSIYRNPYDERKFHAVFTTNNNGLTGSAICTFSLDAIQEAFNGKFKEQQSSTAAWLPVPSYKLNPNEPRPGTCVDDTQALSDNLVTFIRGHPLMDSAVANDNNRPVFYRRDIMFTKIVVDVVEIDGLRYIVYFVGTNTGHVYKIVEWSSGSQSMGQMDPPTGSGGGGFLSALSEAISAGTAGLSNGAASGSATTSGANSQSALVEVIEATVPEPVRAIEISSRHKSLYVASDSQVRQFNLQNCKQRHDNCMQCVRDPYCGWDRKHLECRHFSPIDPMNLVQDVTGETPDLCHSVIKHKDVHVNWGQSVHLPCKFNGFIQETQDLQQLLASQQRQSVQQQQQQARQAAAGSPTSFYGGALQQQQPQLTNSQTSGDAYIQQTVSQFQGQPHGLLQPASYIQWYYHKASKIISAGYPLLQHRDRFVLAADQGLVIMNAQEPGWYQCRLGNQVIHSYNLIIDTKTCAAPNESEFRRIYADWCREMERYKSAYRQWHAKQNQCQAMNAIPQQGRPVLMSNPAKMAPLDVDPSPGGLWTNEG